MAEERILPPFPDELVTGGNKQDAILFLLELGLPGRIAASHLSRWGEVTGVTLFAEDIARIRRGLGRRS